MRGATLAAEEWVDWDWVARNLDDVAAALQEHVVLSVAAVTLGLAVSLPLGVAASRRPWLASPLLSVSGVIYAIPSLALFVALGPFTGYLSVTTALIPLVGYTLLILIRNVLAGLSAVPADIKEAATGMGYSPARRLLAVELPLAVPAIVAGVRVATVSTTALVTVAFVVNRGGLGELIYLGLQRGFPTPLVVGTVLSIALAVLADVLLVGVQRWVTPWQRRGR